MPLPLNLLTSAAGSIAKGGLSSLGGEAAKSLFKGDDAGGSQTSDFQDSMKSFNGAGLAGLGGGAGALMGVPLFRGHGPVVQQPAGDGGADAEIKALEDALKTASPADKPALEQLLGEKVAERDQADAPAQASAPAADPFQQAIGAIKMGMAAKNNAEDAGKAEMKDMGKAVKDLMSGNMDAFQNDMQAVEKDKNDVKNNMDLVGQSFTEAKKDLGEAMGGVGSGIEKGLEGFSPHNLLNGIEKPFVNPGVHTAAEALQDNMLQSSPLVSAEA